MFRSFMRCTMLVASISLLAGCNWYQPTKNVWKGTKDLWNTYVSVPATVDYDEKGDLSPRALALTNGMMGIDIELSRLERAMVNADKSPTAEWLSQFMASFPWLSGFAGVKADGTLLGQEPAVALKELDFIPLLYEDKKQNSRALRADVQNTPLGPEVLLASPLYDGTDFLGVIVAHFDMRNLITFSSNPSDLVVLSPYALLWPGKYDYAATPLAGVNWAEAVSKSSSGTCTNERGTFYYLVRYLGNTPLIFAVAESGDFPQGNGSLEQGLAFFPKDREKLPVPPQPERKNKPDMSMAPAFGASAVNDATQGEGASTQAGEMQPGSHDSMLLKESAPSKPHLQERQLEGENVKPRRRAMPEPMPEPMPEMSTPQLVRPSPFGPQGQVSRPSPFGPAADKEKAEQDTPEQAKEQTPAQTSAQTPAQPQEAGGQEAKTDAASQPASDTAEKAPASDSKTDAAPASSAEEAKQPAATDSGEAPKPAMLPGGRPSPFGPQE